MKVSDMINTLQNVLENIGDIDVKIGFDEEHDRAYKIVGSDLRGKANEAPSWVFWYSPDGVWLE